MPDASKELTVVVLTYNSGAIIQAALARLDGRKHDVVVVDNASSDDSVRIVEEHFPQFTRLSSARNVGYGRGNNLALRQVKTEFALVLNPDATVEEDSIERVLKVLKSDPSIALAGAMKFRVFKDGRIADDASAKQANARFFLGEEKDFFLSKFILGAAMFFNMRAMREVGFFDERFFLYGEDNELCKRAMRHGFKTVVVKDTQVLHLGGQSSKRDEAEEQRIYWHKHGWSPCHYTRCMHGVIPAKLKALRILLKGGVLASWEMLRGRRITPATRGMLRGSFGFFIGQKAFTKDDEARG